MTVVPALAESAFLGSTSNLISRIEIYKADGTTRWENGDNDDRLITGAVTVDYDRDERRSFDLELDNSDFVLEHAPGQFWYDKILKIYSGVKYVDTTPVISYLVRTNYSTNPRVATVTTGYGGNYGTAGAATAARITSAGDPDGHGTAYEITWSTGSSNVSGGAYYQMLSPGTAGAVVPGEPMSGRLLVRCSKIQRMETLFYFYDDAGTLLSSGRFDTKVVAANTWTEFIAENVIPPAGATRVLIGCYSVSGTSGTNWAINDKVAITGILIEKGDKFKGEFTGASTDFANRDYSWSGAADASLSLETITVSTPTAVLTIWETQVGEFMIDKIAEAHFPYTVKVSGRDYTKKCMLSKYKTATSYASGTAIETAIKSIAQAAGITKFLFPATGHSLGKAYFFERGVSRWEAMKKIADAFGYELFFDAQGYLLMREYLDPISAPLVYTLATGPDVGNLVTYEKNLNDNRIYNVIVVTGESSDAGIPPVSAIATNTEPSSPTRVSEIGERVYQYSSAFITTTLQAQDVADKFLKIHALEEFDLNFAAINLPWLEVGEIIEFVDPRPNAGQPTRFLLSSLSLSLGLDTMSGNAKRVSVVG